MGAAQVRNRPLASGYKTETVRHVSRFAIGDVLKASFSVYGRNLPAAAVLVAIAYVPAFAIAVAIANRPAASPSLLGLENDAALALAYLAGDPFAAAGLAYVAVRTLRSGPPTLGDALAYAVRAFPLVLLTTCVLYMAFLLGLVALVLPGVIVMVVFWVVPQVAAVERSGVAAAFRRSRALTKGNRVALFGLILLLLVPSLAAAQLPALTPFPPQYHHLFDAMLTAALASVGGTVAGVTYHDLRVGKEGSGKSIAEVFA